jgi:mRNA interferase RelE/StbE
MTEDAIDDLQDLDGAVRLQVFKALLKLETSPDQRGAPLGSNLGGNLTGFRKLIVGRKDYRIVYRVEDDGTASVVMVIARRSDNEAYELALARVRLHGDTNIRDLAVPLEAILRR